MKLKPQDKYEWHIIWAGIISSVVAILLIFLLIILTK